METFAFTNKKTFHETLDKITKEFNRELAVTHKRKMGRPCKCIMIRFFEKGKSYEDYSMSYMIDTGKRIDNFIVEEDNDTLIFKKTNKHATRHIKFKVEEPISMVKMPKAKPYIAIYVNSEIYYTDGTHRYNK